MSTGEFLVDFDDEFEGQGWTSMNQTWKHISPLPPNKDADKPHGELSPDGLSLDEALLGQHEKRPSATVPSSRLNEGDPLSTVFSQEATGSESEDGLLQLFVQLYNETVSSDGCVICFRVPRHCRGIVTDCDDAPQIWGRSVQSNENALPRPDRQYAVGGCRRSPTEGICTCQEKWCYIPPKEECLACDYQAPECPRSHQHMNASIKHVEYVG